MIIVILLLVIVGAFIWWIVSIYHFVTVSQPTYGGQYTEAFVGQPRYINPLLSYSSASDRNLTKLIFSGLFDYDENGMLRNDIAERFEVSDDVKEYTIYLRKDVKWHDDEQLTVDDVIFTVNIAKDITYGAAGVSNETRLTWSDVEVEKIDDYTVKFKLKEPDSTFLHNLTLGLIPKHIWENISPEQFQLSEFNQKPIGSGPYEFVDFDINTDSDTISSYILRSNEEYYKDKAFITKFIANFYPTRAEAVEAYNNGEVSAVMVDKREHTDALAGMAQKQSIELPHYFAVFFNQTKSVPLAYDEVREAISSATNREALIQEVFGDNAQARYSPFAEGVVGFDSEKQQLGFDLDRANNLLEEKGWEKGEDGIRSKGEDRLSFTLHVNSSQYELVHIAEILQQQWKEIGVELQIQEHDKTDLEANVIKPRDYDALLYAHQMRFEPNLLPLWHSKEIDDPGLNYALFDDEEMDKALVELVETQNTDERNELYKKQQERLQKEVPAIFLFAPKLSFMYNDNIKGININRANLSSDRYANINKWYIKEKRVKK